MNCVYNYMQCVWTLLLLQVCMCGLHEGVFVIFLCWCVFVCVYIYVRVHVCAI